MKIPIENVYYLLCYAWDKLDEKDRVRIRVEDCSSFSDLFARILINATRILLRRGVDRTYIDRTEERYGVKGKVDISDTLKRDLLSHQKTVCTFDEFSVDTLPNRILVTTLYRLTHVRGLDRGLKKEVISLLRMLPGIQLLEITAGLFHQVRLHRNNRLYGFVMNVCRIVHESTLPTETPGTYQFSDFTRDEKQMAHLFEAFVRNFYRLEQTTYPVVRREVISWQFTAADEVSRQHLPQMNTDITLENNEHKIIIDTKFYQRTMTSNFDAERIHAANLYQLFSYMINQHTHDPRTHEATGILLYPSVNDEYDLSYSYQKHTIGIRTVDLSQNWKEVSRQLLQIIEGVELPRRNTSTLQPQ
jgi:5-methylcytosine-specific restriction enzyme subunit McrC